MKQKSEFNLQDVKCASCVGKIQNKLNKMPGIKDARVNLLEKKLLVEYSSKKLDEKVIAAVVSLGYQASAEEQPQDKQNLWLYIALPLIAGLILMTAAMLKMPDYMTGAGFIRGIAEAIFTLSVVLIAGRTIFVSGWRGFRTLNFNMHSLIVLGVSAAWLYSSWVIVINHFQHFVIPPQVYFESALIIIGLINLGSYLEERAKSNTTAAIKALASLQPNETIIINDGVEQVINTNLVRTGYIVKTLPGARIAADGIIIEGESFIDESMLSGEPLAIGKKAGDKVIAGSVNTNGMFLFRVTAVGDSTILAEIIELVKSAQMSKPPLAKVADQVALVFVPLIILIAIIAAAIWWFIGPSPQLFYSVTIFMTVLIIACPCSVGLAIPVSLMVGLGRSAAKGILIRDAACLNAIAHLNYVLLDKTGTITSGKPQVISLVSQIPKAECLMLMQALEKNSEHPLAHAVLSYMPGIKNNLSVTNFKVSVSGGISGTISDKEYFLGSKTWLQTRVKNPNSLNCENNFTQIFLADENNVLARMDITDTIKADSAAAIADLHKMGIKVAMVTGDNINNANYIASLVKINEVYANTTPDGKIKIVQKLQKQNQQVAFVGDGINDAPSLTQADVGIAIGSGSDIAMQSADITLMRDSLTGISEAIKIGRKIKRNMYQNLFGSFVYNLVAVVIAAGALYPLWHILLNPVIASIAMSLSSLTVILNALRLQRI